VLYQALKLFGVGVAVEVYGVGLAAEVMGVYGAVEVYDVCGVVYGCRGGNGVLYGWLWR
jgi:hypothetical protein